MDGNEKRADATALAGACIATAILDKLHEKGLFTLEEARGVLTSAMREVGSNSQAPAAYDASTLIGEMLKGRFSAR